MSLSQALNQFAQNLGRYHLFHTTYHIHSPEYYGAGDNDISYVALGMIDSKELYEEAAKLGINRRVAVKPNNFLKGESQ